MDILYTTINDFLTAAVPSADASTYAGLIDLFSLTFTMVFFIALIIRLLRAFRIIEPKNVR